jgi:hypothetical protein
MAKNVMEEISDDEGDNKTVNALAKAFKNKIIDKENESD